MPTQASLWFGGLLSLKRTGFPGTASKISMFLLEVIADEVSGKALSLKEMPRKIEDSDIIISAVSGNVPLIGKGAIETALKRRKHKPIYMVDLGVPRNIETEVKELKDIFLYTLDNIQDLIKKNYKTREDAAIDAQHIVNSKVDEYMNWRKSQSAFSIIKHYRDDCEEIRENCLNKSLNQLRLGKDPEDVINQLLAIGSKMSDPEYRKSLLQEKINLSTRLQMILTEIDFYDVDTNGGANLSIPIDEIAVLIQESFKELAKIAM